MRRIIRFIVPVVAIVLGAVMGLSSSTPARAVGPLTFYAGFNDSSRCALHGHAHGSPITITCTSSELQSWNTTNGKRWTSLHNGIVQVEELQVASTNLCVNLSSSYVFYLDSCVAGDDNELFWQEPVPGSSGPNFYFINVEASTLSGEYEYMTVESFGENETVFAEAPGGTHNVWWMCCAMT